GLDRLAAERPAAPAMNGAPEAPRQGGVPASDRRIVGAERADPAVAASDHAVRRRGELAERHRLDRFRTEARPLGQQSPLPCPEALFEGEGIGPNKAAMGEQRAYRQAVNGRDPGQPRAEAFVGLGLRRDRQQARQRELGQTGSPISAKAPRLPSIAAPSIRSSPLTIAATASRVTTAKIRAVTPPVASTSR